MAKAILKTHHLSNATGSPLLAKHSRRELGEGIGVRSMAGQFLKAAAVSTEKTVEIMKLTKKQIEVTMFVAGARNVSGLTIKRLSKS